LKEVANHERYTFEKGDICDRGLIEELFKKYDFKGVIHFAAESHVDNSIINPDAFIQTNILGTFNLLDTAKKHWMVAPGVYNTDYSNCRFHHVSTDEVYGSLGETGLLTETTP
jgi:dTDP-glucose 4,6-dehydratase